MAITSKNEIPPKDSAEFVFRARNPASGELVWKAHQHFVDGTTADWIGAAGEKRPASVTKHAQSHVDEVTSSGNTPRSREGCPCPSLMT